MSEFFPGSYEFYEEHCPQKTLTTNGLAHFKVRGIDFRFYKKF